MKTQFVSSSDGVKIAYDVCGDGPAIVLIHGGGSFRQEWHAERWVRKTYLGPQVSVRVGLLSSNR